MAVGGVPAWQSRSRVAGLRAVAEEAVVTGAVVYGVLTMASFHLVTAVVGARDPVIDRDRCECRPGSPGAGSQVSLTVAEEARCRSCRDITAC